MPARIEPALPPFDDNVSVALDRVMKGQPPLRLFTTLARDPRLFQKFFAGGLLDKGNLSLRQREIVIHRTTALCGSEYEWGVHAAIFAGHAGLTQAQLRSTVKGSAEDACWSDEDRVLLRLCDALHERCDIDDGLWALLQQHFTGNAIIELLMLAGFYRTVSYLTNGLRMPVEEAAARFPA
ncbi:MAG: carboxymuconolactone decarboxylase family protein [Hydrogenophaga sp.]|jgi:alkylhydroperoxidase family enzyme|uniref:carboxymuconolactone decarboxylase family protein n=1 Tax=Hydrogenophaga sp. TaxID=1904254 RepID=UPI00261AE6E6|nr:carboxymuconolactone decarboxylase family protein [Hydrogenophaga sp.]MCV0438302.1 carboxymuconolactone decarboxylase family protein [Hydrogenophaga sp.]